jgi:hypothetical protein
MHKIYNGVKFDDDGEIIKENLDPKQRRFFELKEMYKYTPSKLFEKAFDQCWNEGGMDFDASELDMKLEELEEAERNKDMLSKSKFGEGK